MKRTIKFLGILFLGTFALTSCSNQDCKKEMEALKNENDSLRNLMSNIKSRNIAIPLADAEKLTGNFRNPNIKTIHIPLAWSFTQTDISELLLQTDKNGYVRFYSALKLDTDNKYKMTLVAVPTDGSPDGNDKTDYTYDFAAPCPEKCSKFNNLIPAGTVKEYKVFNR